MAAYLQKIEPAEAYQITRTYQDGEAFAWWHLHSSTTPVANWETLRAALIRRFSPLNKAQAARNKLHLWRQIKDGGTLKKSFLSIILDIPDITEDKKIDCYSRRLKRNTWEPLCTKKYSDLESLFK